MSDKDPKFELFKKGDVLDFNGRWSVKWSRPGVKGEVMLPVTSGIWVAAPLAEELGLTVEVSAEIAKRALEEQPKLVMHLKTKTVRFKDEAEASQMRAWYSARFGKDPEVEEVYEYRR
jgi:hypothetical protein